MWIATRAELESWLQEHYWLEGAAVERLHPLPELDGPPPETVELHLWQQIGGSLVAGKERHVREIDIVASGVSDYQLAPGGFVPDHRSQGVELLPSTETPLAFEIDVPEPLRLLCAALRVETTERSETVPAWFSNREFYVEATGTLPSPTQWLEAFAARGVKVTWRFYGSPAKSVAAVPEDYGGWYLQAPEHLEATLGGLFFRDVRQNGSRFRLVAEVGSENAVPLWRTAGAIVAEMAEAEIRCGNVKMSGPEWRAQLSRWESSAEPP